MRSELPRISMSLSFWKRPRTRVTVSREVLTRLAGASGSASANAGVIAAVVLLTFHGWAAARAAQLHGWPLAGATAIAAALGLAMVALKNLVILHLH